MPVLSTPIASRANPRIKQLRAAFSGNDRLSQGLVAIEGENLVREALRSGIEPRTIFITDRFGAPAWLPQRAEILPVAEDVFASAVDTQHPQGIAALLHPPHWSVESLDLRNALLLVAARLQDPGNLGALIRSAEGFGATAVLATAGTVSAWNQKVMRASAGSVFRMPVISVSAAILKSLQSQGVRLLAAVAGDPEAGAHHPDNVGLTGACALMIGNEGSGLDAELLNLADDRITIPMPGRIESLNAAVAGSLLLYEAARQRSASKFKR